VEKLTHASNPVNYGSGITGTRDHAFNRLDTSLAKESRKEIYAFLAKHLKM